MAMNQASSWNILVEDNQINGAAIFDPQGRRIGAVKRRYRDANGHLVFADAVVDGFLGFGACCYVFPWENLVYDPVLNGYRVSRAEMDRITRIDKPYVSPRRLLHGRW